MTDRLRLRLEEDSDGTAELFVEAASGAFSGAGSAWFDLQELREFGVRLQESFPIPQNSPIELQGGFWGGARPATLDQRHVGLRFSPIDFSGRVGVQVHLSTPIHIGQRMESRSSASFELTTYYEALRSFGASVVALVEGRSKVAELVLHVA